MQGTHKGRQNSEGKRKELLAKVALLRAEAEEFGAEAPFLESIDKIGQDVVSARVSVRRHRDFLRGESDQVEKIREVLYAAKETERKNFIGHLKSSALMLLLTFFPLIFINKLYYLSLIPRKIPVSSLLLYMGMGDILFYTWIFVCILYSVAYRYITIHYIIPFVRRNPSLKIPTRFCSASTFIFLYGQFLFYSASIAPKLISPSWGPSLATILHLVTVFLTSSPIAAITVLISLWPVVGTIVKKWKLFRFHKIH